MTIAAVLLAAGGGTRFEADVHKLRAPLGDTSVIQKSVAAALAAAFDETIVVEGAVPLDDLLPSTVTVVRNDEWESGLAGSLCVACDVAAAHGHDVVVVGLGDQPGLTADSWRAVGTTEAPIAVATYEGRRGHPVRLRSDVWAMLPVGGELGARVVMSLRPDLVREVPCRGTPLDIDTWEDLERWS